MARRVSKLLPRVSKLAMPLAGAVQASQTEVPPTLPACLGSFASRVAPRLLPLPRPASPTIVPAAAYGSAMGSASLRTRSVTLSLPATPTPLNTTT